MNKNYKILSDNQKIQRTNRTNNYKKMINLAKLQRNRLKVIIQ